MTDSDEEMPEGQRCPICHFPTDHGKETNCEHYWGMTYDYDMYGPYGTEFEELWGVLESTYQTTDEAQSERLLTLLLEAGLEDVAHAVEIGEKFWWLSAVLDKVYIDAEAHPASGSGWVLYHRDPTWFEGVLERMREGAALCEQASSGPL